MVIALSSFSATLGLVVVFFVIFPALVTGLLASAIALVFGERGENQAYLARRRESRQSVAVAGPSQSSPAPPGASASRPRAVSRRRTGSPCSTSTRPAPRPPRRRSAATRSGRRATSRADSVAGAVDDVVERCGGIDVAIANAGIATAGGLRHLDPDVLAAQLDVNLVGSWRFIHACLPHVIARRGYVLGVASAAAIVAPVGIGVYASTRRASSTAQRLRIEVSHLGVDVGIAFFSVDRHRHSARHRDPPARVRQAALGHPGRPDARSRCRPPARPSPSAVGPPPRTVVAPGVRIAYVLRGLIGPLVDATAVAARPWSTAHGRAGRRARPLRRGGMRPGETGAGHARGPAPRAGAPDSPASSFARSTSPAPPTDSIARSAPVARDVPDRERAVVDRAHDLLVPAQRRADVLERGPVGEVGEEVRDDVVRRVGAEHVARGGRRPGRGDVLVLDAHVAAAWTTLSYSQMSPAAKTPLGGRAQLRVAAHAAEVAELQARLAGEHHVGRRADAADDGARASSVRPPVVDAARPRRVARRRASKRSTSSSPTTSMPCASSTPRKQRAGAGAELRARAARPPASRPCTRLPSAVSEAATSQPM